MSVRNRDNAGIILFLLFLFGVWDSRELHMEVVIKLMIRYSIIKNPLTRSEQEVPSERAVFILVKNISFTMHFLFCQTFGNILHYILEVKHHGIESKFFV